MSLEDTVRYLTQDHPVVAALVLFASSALEYIFPPFPGDTVTIGGAVLVVLYGYSLWAVLGAVVLGGVVGAAFDYYVGLQLAKGQESLASRLGVARMASKAMDKVAGAFARHGEAYIAVNRFFPGVRAFVFVAAGMARMRFWRVMFWSVISSVAWNLLLVTVGLLVGANLPLLERLVARYTQAVWVALGLAALVLALRWWRRRPS